MDIATTYMGMKLRSPLVPSASPLSEDIGQIRHMEDAGAGAVVLYSLFEEQLTHERREFHHYLEHGTDSYPEALTYFLDPVEYHLGPEEYLTHIQKAKKAVKIPVIASLNCVSLGGWTDFAKNVEQAGADALELNIYYIPTRPDISGAEIEQRYLDIVKSVRSAVKIPLALKLSPFFSNFAHMAKQFDSTGINALVLFNRFYQPDIDIETLEMESQIILSTPFALRLPMTWIGILFGRIKSDLAATRGIHKGKDVIKMTMAGAKITMLCSSLLKNGIDHIRVIEKELIQWMEENSYQSLETMRGSMSQLHCPDPSTYERQQYMRVLRSYRPAL